MKLTDTSGIPLASKYGEYLLDSNMRYYFYKLGTVFFKMFFWARKYSICLCPSQVLRIRLGGQLDVCRGVIFWVVVCRLIQKCFNVIYLKILSHFLVGQNLYRGRGVKFYV